MGERGNQVAHRRSHESLTFMDSRLIDGWQKIAVVLTERRAVAA